MKEYSPHQKKIIERYYDQRDVIMLTKLQELASELYLADTDKKKERLWERVRLALANLKVGPQLSEHILTRKDPAVLARNVADWLKQAPSAGRRPST